ncbi:MAG: hypothetical protein QOJ12_2324, partial [Thermoleophilales bacterium]|nr:hypothetical protein [Thermoleophilales bacterium]
MTTTVTSPVLVGRQGELEALDAVLAESAEGRPAAALVSGEAGVGKSRLLAELAVRAADRGTRVLVGHCVELAEGELPYAPIIGALRALSADLGPDELDDVLGPARSELTRLVPDLASGSAPHVPENAQPGQAQLFELLLGVFGRLSRERPV